MNYLSLNIRYLRELKNLTQSKVADDIGVKRTSIATWEKTLKNFNVDYLIAFSKYFDISIDDLLLKDLSKEGYKRKAEVENQLNEKEAQYLSGKAVNTERGLPEEIKRLSEALAEMGRAQNTLSAVSLEQARAINALLGGKGKQREEKK